MSTKDANAVQTIPQSAATGDLKLMSVGNGRFVATFHRNAYRQPIGLQSPRKDA